MSDGTLCPKCQHRVRQHRISDGRCACRGCRCVNVAVMVAPAATSPVEQREADLANVAVRLRAAVVDGDTGRAMAIARACWDAGHTAHCRNGGKGET